MLNYPATYPDGGGAADIARRLARHAIGEMQLPGPSARL